MQAMKVEIEKFLVDENESPFDGLLERDQFFFLFQHLRFHLHNCTNSSLPSLFSSSTNLSSKLSSGTSVCFTTKRKKRKTRCKRRFVIQVFPLYLSFLHYKYWYIKISNYWPRNNEHREDGSLLFLPDGMMAGEMSRSEEREREE